MRNVFVFVCFALLFGCLDVTAQEFDQWFQDKTLRLDYAFSGDRHNQYISVNEIRCFDNWYGRRVNMDSLLLLGNGQLCMRDSKSGRVLYRYSFSTLFQEWQTTEEASQIQKSFENVFLVPFPKYPVDITVTLTDTHNSINGKLTHHVDPQDILIRPVSVDNSIKWNYLEKSGDSKDKIDVVFVAEGYLDSEMDVFEQDCKASIGALKSHEPFRTFSDRFNFIAVMVPSQQQGVSIPHDNVWRNTVLNSNFDTFYSNRYLTTLHLKKLHDVLSGLPYEHIIILVNTDNYGGGGIYNSFLMSAAHNDKNQPVVVHEFGHSFAGLADEYYYDDEFEDFFPSDTEPWEPNITTLVDFKSKWADMLNSGTKIPTEPSGRDLYTQVGVYEGGGYQSKGVYRPVQECRMKVNEAPVFCPVCQRAIKRMIDYVTIQ
ncbi:MAG: peptidase M64 [Bacteroidaceae bacterium]|nr:peptidase M64 [Bacteroidaceae bacterium]